MRMPTFNKLEKYDKKVLCGFCGESLVLLKDWNKRCDKCRTQKDIGDRKSNIIIAKSKPAAVIELEGTDQKVFVDKNGKEVDNPGYDLNNDPRGYKYTNGSSTKGKTYI